MACGNGGDGNVSNWTDCNAAAEVEEAVTGRCDDFKFRLYPAVMSVSCVSLLITIAVYALLPELRNLPGKNLICMSSSLLMAFACLIGMILIISRYRHVLKS